MAASSSSDTAFWDQCYRDGGDGWELGRPAPPLVHFLQRNPHAPRPPGRVLVPGCGRGHEAALLAQLGFPTIGLDVSGEALQEARRLHGPRHGHLRWLQADLFDGHALAEAGLGAASLAGVVEHTCFCAIAPEQRPAWLAQMHHLLEPGGWLLGLFWCHRRPGGPPYGSDPDALADQLRAAGFVAQIWQPATGSVDSRENEWLGLWRRRRGQLGLGCTRLDGLPMTGQILETERPFSSMEESKTYHCTVEGEKLKKFSNERGHDWLCPKCGSITIPLVL